MIYELVTSEEYELAEEHNLCYRVENGGTEAITPLVDASGNPVTAPFVADIQYPFDASSIIKKDSMDAILTAFKTAGVISGYTLTYDSANDDYDCTITQ